MAHALITGASEGIGRELARCAARDGYDVILTARSEHKLRDVAEDLQAEFAVKVHVILADLSDPDTPAKLWADARNGRDIEVLVNNAGLGINGPFLETDWGRERDTINVNIMALTDLMKRAAQDMAVRGRGKILNVASVAGFMPGPKMAVYHASKAYVLALSEAVADELSGTRVKVTALCPGPTETEFFEGADMRSVRLINTGALASAEDVAKAGWSAMKAGQRIHVPGLSNKIFAMLPRFFPRRISTWVTRQVYARKH